MMIRDLIDSGQIYPISALVQYRDESNRKFMSSEITGKNMFYHEFYNELNLTKICYGDSFHTFFQTNDKTITEHNDNMLMKFLFQKNEVFKSDMEKNEQSYKELYQEEKQILAKIKRNFSYME